MATATFSRLVNTKISARWFYCVACLVFHAKIVFRSTVFREDCESNEYIDRPPPYSSPWILLPFLQFASERLSASPGPLRPPSLIVFIQAKLIILLVVLFLTDGIRAARRPLLLMCEICT